MIKFTDKEKDSLNKIIGRYTSVSAQLNIALEQAKSIQERVNDLKNEMSEIKKEEDKLMKKLHKKYGAFGIQDVYVSLNQ